MKNSQKWLLSLALIPYLAGAGYFQMAEFAKNRLNTTEEVLVEAPSSLQESAFSNGSLGEVRMFAGNFAPRGWAFCNGQLLPISQYSALFSILGTTYGGDGRTTFALPDMKGRVPVGVGKNEGDQNVQLGQKKGRGLFNLKQSTIKTADSGQEINVVTDNQFRNHQPCLGLNFVICLQGVYPSRN